MKKILGAILLFAIAFFLYLVLAGRDPEPLFAASSADAQRDFAGMGYRVALDEMGYVYVTGFMAPHDQEKEGGAEPMQGMQIMLRKFTPDLSRECYSVQFGGLGDEIGHSLCLDRRGHVLLAGTSRSIDFPKKEEEGSWPAGRSHAFLLKVDANSGALVFAKGWGADGDCYAHGVEVDIDGYIHLTGAAKGNGLPSFGRDVLPGSGGVNIFWMKLDANGTVVNALRMGGDGDEEGEQMALAANGDIYICGQTSSENFPRRPGAGRQSYQGKGDAFVVRLGTDGTWRDSLLLGGKKDSDCFHSIALDGRSGELLLGGYSYGDDFPLTANAMQKNYAGNEDNAIVRLGADDLDVRYSSYLGGADREDIHRIIAAGNGICFVGETASADYPLASVATPGWYGGGSRDGFLGVMDASGKLLHSSFMGSNAYDSANGLAIYGDNIYVAGQISRNGLLEMTARRLGFKLERRNRGFICRFPMGGIGLK